MTRSKIYYIANARMPTERAHGLQIAKMCEAFIEAGVDVELIVPRRGAMNQSLQDFYGLRAAVPIKKLAVLDWYHRGRIGFWLSSCTFMAAYFFYFLWLRLRSGTGVVYTTDIDQFSWACIPFVGKRYFVELHDAKKYGMLYAFFLRRAEGIVVINERIKYAVMREFGIPENRVRVHPNGIDLVFFSDMPSQSEARAALGIPRDRFIALYLGKIYPWKGLGIIAEAARLASGSFFYLVGGTRKEFEETTKSTIGNASILCMGHRPYQEVRQWLAAADVLLVLGTRAHEYSYYHTSPMKLFEYMASHRPIVAARTPANEEIVSDEEVIFYMPDDAADCARAIGETRVDPEAHREKTARAYEKVRPYAWPARARSILDFIAAN